MLDQIEITGLDRITPSMKATGAIHENESSRGSNGFWRGRRRKSKADKTDELDSGRHRNSYQIDLDVFSTPDTGSNATSEETLESLSEEVKSHLGVSEPETSAPSKTEKERIRVPPITEEKPFVDGVPLKKIFKGILGVGETPKPAEGKLVRFSTVDIREYPICMGDNPGASKGVPITIDWDYIPMESIPVDDFEQRPRRYNLNEFRMTSLDRVRVLKRLGYSGQEIQTQVTNVNDAREKRRASVRTSGITGYLEGSERIRRAVLNYTFRALAKRAERKYLAPYQSKMITGK